LKYRAVNSNESAAGRWLARRDNDGESEAQSVRKSKKDLNAKDAEDFAKGRKEVFPGELCGELCGSLRFRFLLIQTGTDAVCEIASVPRNVEFW
jgi:hypothetical protein